MASIMQTLHERGFVAQVSDEKLGEYLDAQPVTVYAGFDPTADSLHLGMWSRSWRSLIFSGRGIACFSWSARPPA